MEGHFRIIARFNKTFMFMAPNDKVKEVREEIFGQIASFGVSMAGTDISKGIWRVV